MEGLNCFGWTSGAGGGGGGGNISGGGTVYTLAMFTPTNTSIGDSNASQVPFTTRVSTFNSGITDAFQIGANNYIDHSFGIAIGFSLNSYCIGDFVWGTTFNFLNPTPSNTGDFNFWIGGDNNTFNYTRQNIANIYHCTVDTSESCVMYGHFNSYVNTTYSDMLGHYSQYNTVSYSNIMGITSSFSDVLNSNFIVTNSQISGMVNGRSGALGDTITFDGNSFTGCDYSYALGYNLLVSHNLNTLIGHDIQSHFDNEIVLGHNESTKFIVRPNDFEFQFSQNGGSSPLNSENISGDFLATTDATVTPIQTISIPTDTVVMLESYITCRKVSGAGVGEVGAGNGYIRTVKAQNIAGVVTIGVVQSSFTSESITTFNATFAVSGTNVVVNVVGSANNNVNWHSITKKYKVE